MEILFFLTLPGLVVIIIVLGVIRLVRARLTGERRPGAASIGMDMLDTVLRPGSEHRLEESEQNRVTRQEQGAGEGFDPSDSTDFQ